MGLVLAGVGLAIKGWLAKTFTLRAETHMADGTTLRFATRDDLNGYGERVNLLDGRLTQVREVSFANRDEIRALRQDQAHQWERITAQVIDPLGRITAQLEAVSVAQARQAATLEIFVKHVEGLSHPNA